MRNIKSHIGVLSVSLVSLVASGTLLASSPVYARGSDDTSSTSTTTSSSVSGPVSTSTTSNTSTSTSTTAPSTTTTNSGSSKTVVKSSDTEEADTTTTTEHGVEVETQNGTNDSPQTRVGSLQAKAKQLLEASRADSPTKHSVADRQKACTTRQAEIDSRIARYNTDAKKLLTSYDNVFTRVQAYQTTNQLADTQYVSLVATANLKKTAASGAVAALSMVSVKIDCTAADPAAAITTVKTAVATTRAALHDYRSAVKDIVVSLLTVKNASSDTTVNTTEGTN